MPGRTEALLTPVCASLSLMLDQIPNEGVDHSVVPCVGVAALVKADMAPALRDDNLYVRQILLFQGEIRSYGDPWVVAGVQHKRGNFDGVYEPRACRPVVIIGCIQKPVAGSDPIIVEGKDRIGAFDATSLVLGEVA